MPAGEVQLVSLVKRFESFTAVDGIDLDIPSGEFFSLLGPSGCGKTTTLRMIAGFEQPDAPARCASTASTWPAPPRTAGRSTRCSRATRCSRTCGCTTTSRSGCGARTSTGRDPAPRGRRRSSSSSSSASRRRKPAPAVRRAAAAGRAGPRARAAARRAAARRAARGARRQAATAAAGRAQAAAGAGRHHLPLRDARPGGSAHDERPHRRDEPRPRRAVRPAARGVRGARPPRSSPTSSASPT